MARKRHPGLGRRSELEGQADVTWAPCGCPLLDPERTSSSLVLRRKALTLRRRLLRAEIDDAFDTLRGMRASALLVQPDAFLINKRIVALAARDALPAVYQTRKLVSAGGLMSYGSSLADMYRQMGIYAGKVLKGANPAELPVLQPTKFELVINLKTANALGLKVPDKLISLADEVIE
jgi:putative tryptophan/tyrosine transport system substrate-binding protein